MDPVSHVAFGTTLVGLDSRRTLGHGAIAACVIGSLAPDLDAGRPWSAVVLREQRPSPRDARSGLTMLLAPAPSVELRTHARRAPPR